MKTLSRLLAAGAFALAMPVALSAQTTPATAAPAAPAAAGKLEIGKWTGNVDAPGAGLIPLTFDVTAAGDTMKINMTIEGMGVFPFTAVKLEGTKLSFGFVVESSDVTCKLEKKEDGSFAGPCVDQSGQGGPMTMVPPKKGVPTP